MIIGEKKKYLRREFKLVDIDPNKQFVVVKETKFGSPEVKMPYITWENPPEARIIVRLEIIDQLQSGMGINAMKIVDERFLEDNKEVIPTNLVADLIDSLKKELIPLFIKISNGEPIEGMKPPAGGNGHG